MKTTKIALLSIVSLVAFSGTTLAQQDKFIENQRYIVGIDDFLWGDTYIGKYTSTNGLIIEEIIDDGETNKLNLAVTSLNIGSSTNSGNYVDIRGGGTIEVENEVIINAPGNGNRLTIRDKGTLFAKSDFDANLGGFSYDPGGRLKVGGEISNLDNVEGGLEFTLTGESATWNFNTNLLTVGALSSANSVIVSNNATLDIDNINIGSISTTSNNLVVTDSARMDVRDSINIFNGSGVQITNDGVLAVHFDFAPLTEDKLDISLGGILEAHKNLDYVNSITNGGGIIMTGEDATWTSLSGSTLQISKGIVGTGESRSFLTVTNGATVRVGNFEIDSFEDEFDEGNEIRVVDGGNLIIENTGSYIANKGATLRVTDGGKLTFESDYDVDGFIRWYNGGIIEALAEAPKLGRLRVNGEYIENGQLFLQNGQILILNGLGATWTAPTNNLHIGDLTSDNHLIITNGGTAIVNSSSIGDFEEGGNNNSMLITGTNSTLTSSSYFAIGGTIDSGNWIEGGTNNWVIVDNAGQLNVGTTLHNRNTTGNTGLKIKPGGIVDASDYYQAAGANLNIYTDATGTNTGLLRVSNTAEFETGAKFGFDAVAALDIGTLYSNVIVESTSLIVGGVTNATTDDLGALENTGGTLVNYDLWETNQNIYATYSRRSISDGSDIDDNSMLGIISKEIDQLAASGNAAASNQVNILSGLGSDAARKRAMEQMYSYQLPTYMHNQGIVGGIDQVRARSSSFSSGGAAGPSGAAGPGPHSGTQEFQPWVKVYGNVGNRDNTSDFDDGYDVQAFGTVLGIDKAYGPLLVGVAGGYASSMIKGDNNDESDATTGYGLIYGTIGTNQWFADIVLSYGLTDIENESGGAFDVESDIDASQTIFYIGGGKEFKDPDGSDAVLRPMAGLQISFYDQDAYTEESTTAVGKDVDAYDRTSYLSTLGAALVFPQEGKKYDIETEFRAYWLHEFNDDEDTIDYTLVGSTTAGEFVVRSPDENIGQFGIGVAADSKTSGLKLRADLDAQFSKTYTSFTLSGALLYEF